MFRSEGIQKFLFPRVLGVGRFVKIRIPWAQFMAAFVGVVEIACSTLLLIGLLTRLAAIPLLIDFVSRCIPRKLSRPPETDFGARYTKLALT
jgi:putative oxidoreductase